MKKLSFLVVFFFLTTIVFAQDIILTFDAEIQGSGVPVTLDNVIIKNLTRGGNVGVVGNSINLTTAVGVEEQLVNNHFGIQKVYPNPFTTELNIEFYSEGKGDSSITIHNLTGQIIASHTDAWMEGNHQFVFTPNTEGVYFVSLQDNGKTYTSKVIATQGASSDAKLSYYGKTRDNEILGTKHTEDGFFQLGDVLQFIGYSGDYINTIYTSPTESQNYTFGMNEGFYRFENYHIEENIPSFVDVMFSVTDEFNKGVDYLTNDDFVVYEDDASVSPTETFRYVKKLDQVPYSQKMVIMLDNSASVTEELTEIKTAAITLINQILTNPLFDDIEIALYSFSDNALLLQDFTGDITLLETAINGITLGFPSTNLYGSLITGLNRWNNSYTLDAIQEGYLIALTDGDDTQGSSTLAQVIAARGNKKVFMVGLGDELTIDPLNQISYPGNYIPVTDINDLEATFINIQYDIYKFSNSFYWLNYMSPKRNGTHSLRVELTENSNTATDSYLEGSFSAAGFESVYSGVYANIEAGSLYGVDEVSWHYDDTDLEPQNFKAVSYWATAPPVYTWSIADESVATVTVDSVDSSRAVVMPQTTDYANTILTLTDIANGFANEITITITNNLPIVITHPVTDILGRTATANGEIINEGSSAVTYKGFCWSTNPNPTLSDSNISGYGTPIFTRTIDLEPTTTYYIRAYAYNSFGTSYGNELTFTTTVGTPLLGNNPLVYSNVTATTVTLEDEVIDDGSTTITARGFCWKIYDGTSPTLSDNYSVEPGGVGVFTSNINGLTPSTNYAVRSYATNSEGTVYDNFNSFQTLSGIAHVVTINTTNITDVTAQSGGGSISANGASIIQKGVCWSTTVNPTITDSHTTEGEGEDNFTSLITGLTEATTYNVRAYVTTEHGTGYGSNRNFTTATTPTVNTTSVNNITSVSAYVTGNLVDDGGLAVTTKGFCWSTSSDPTISDSFIEVSNPQSSGPYSENIDLLPSTTYYLKAFASNQSGISYGEEVSFSTYSGIYQGSIYLSTQSGINSFSLDYPGVVEITGDLFIGNSTDSSHSITSLIGLNSITTIGGTLRILNTSISSLAYNTFPEHLSSAHEIVIWNNLLLTYLGTFNDLLIVESNLKIIGNTSLTHFHSFENITSIEGDLIIENNSSPQFNMCSGFDSLININGLFSLKNVHSSSVQVALHTLASIGGLTLMYCNFDNLDDFESLESIGDQGVFINANQNINDISDYCALQPALINYTGSFYAGLSSGGHVSQSQILDNNCE